MNGILYFSGTGNSLYISKKVQNCFGGKILFVPNYQGDGKEFEKIFIITPIYSYGMPKHILLMLEKLDKSKPIIVIQSYGGMIAGADYLMLQYCQKNGLNIKGIFTIKMPENFTLTFTVPKFYIKSTLKSVDKKLSKIFEAIKNNQFVLPKKKKTKEQKWLKNMSNWHIIGQRFSVNENCIKCGKCINLCPVKNIGLEEDKIVFYDKCVACLGCYHRCPTKAIVYKNKKKKDRYVNPNINENEIGNDC